MLWVAAAGCTWGTGARYVVGIVRTARESCAPREAGGRAAEKEAKEASLRGTTARAVRQCGSVAERGPTVC